MKRQTCLLAVALLAGIQQGEAEMPIQLRAPLVSVPRVATPPRIDGRIEEAEWRTAAQLSGFIDIRSKEFFHRQGQVWICWDPEGLYLAYRASFPAGKQAGGAWDEKALRAFERKRDGRVYTDDSVELYLAPKRPQTFIQFVGNSLGAIFDRRFGELNWQGKWQFANRVDNAAGLWELELGARFEALGLPAPRPGEQWYFNFARTWHGLEHAYTSLTGKYRRLLGKIVFTETAPVVREMSWGRLLSGRVHAKLSVENSSDQARELKFHTRILASETTALDGTEKVKVIQIKPGGTEQFKTTKIVDKPGRYAVSHTLSHAKGHVIYDRTVPFAVYRPIGLKPFYVTQTRRLGVLVDLSKLPVDPIESSASGEVRVIAGGRALGSMALKNIQCLQFPVSVDLTENALNSRLTIVCELVAGRQSFRESVEYQVPPAPEWLGKYEVPAGFVPFPWTPLRVEDGPAVSCWNRRYVFGNSPLPREILTAGKESTASAALRIVTREGKLDWGAVPARVLNRSSGKVVLEKSVQIGSLEVRALTSVEFDGFLWCTVTLTPRHPIEMSRIEMKLFVPPERARFFHVNGKWGDKLYGAVDKRGEFSTLTEEHRYYWLGNDHSGICWFTETLAGWQENPNLLRTGFRKTDKGFAGFFLPWSARQVLREPMTFSFGLQATPARPRHARRIRGFTAYNLPPEKMHMPLAKNSENVLEMSLRGKMNYPPFESDAKQFRRWIAGYHKKGIKFLIYQYIDAGTETEAYRKYWGDWVTSFPPDLYQWRTITAKCCLATSWSDYYCHTLDVMMKDFGADGIYLDGLMARICTRGEDHGGLCTTDRWPLLVARKHLKKLLAVARRNKGLSSFLWGHTSLGAVSPISGLMDAHLKGENYGAPLSYDDLTPEVMRAEFGRQWGTQPILLPQLTKKQLIPTGRLLGLAALHDVDCAPSFLPFKDRNKLLYPFWQVLDEFPVSESDFFPYYEQELITEEKGRPVSVYVGPQRKRLLAIIANQAAKPARFRLQYHPGKLQSHLSARQVYERLTGRQVPFESNRFSMDVDPWGLLVVEISL